MELSQIDSFLAVCRSGGFAQAARDRGVATSSITRAVSKLEDSLGVRLFQRTTRQVTLTEAGEVFLARMTPAMEEVEAAREAATSMSGEPSGHLRIAASVSFGQLKIAPLLGEFREQYPEITVELLLSDQVADIISERIDIAIRHGTLPDSSLIARRLKTTRARVVASPEWVERNGIPESPADIAGYDCCSLSFDPFRSSWTFEQGETRVDVPIRASVTASNELTLRECVRNGLGPGLMASWTLEDDLEEGRMIDLFPDWTSHATGTEIESPIWFVTTSRAFVTAKVIAFETFLEDMKNKHRAACEEEERAPAIGPAAWTAEAS